MTFRRGTRVLMSVIAVLCATGAVSCNPYDALNPCGEAVPYDEHPVGKFMDGSWFLRSINGTVFNGAFQLPDGAVLTTANMDFHTLRVEKGSCEDPEKSSGEVVAAYQLTKAGKVLPVKIVVGGYEHKNKANSVIIRALGYTAGGTATVNVVVAGGLSGPAYDNSTMDIAAKIPLGGDFIDLGSITYNLQFYRSVR